MGHMVTVGEKQAASLGADKERDGCMVTRTSAVGNAVQGNGR